MSSLRTMKRRRVTSYTEDTASFPQDAAYPLERSISSSALDTVDAGDVPPMSRPLNRPPPQPPQPSSLSTDLRFSGIYDDDYFGGRSNYPLVQRFRPLALCEIDDNFTLNRSPVPDHTDFQPSRQNVTIFDKFNLTIFDDNLTVERFLTELSFIADGDPDDNLLNYEDGTPLHFYSPLASFYKTPDLAFTMDSAHSERVLFNFYIQRQLQRDDELYSLRVTFTFPVVAHHEYVIDVVCTQIMQGIYGGRIRKRVRNGVIEYRYWYPLQMRA